MPRLLNIRPNRGGRLLLGMAPLAGLVVLYLVASTARHAANPHDKLLPAFSQMAEAVKLMASVDPLTGRAPLLVDTLASLARLGAGLGIATITALLLGLALGLTVMMVTHDIKEAFKLGTRVLAFDKRRRDPQAPHRYGATAVYDFPVEKRGTVPVQAAALFSDA